MTKPPLDKPFRGSRKHVLDWTGQDAFPSQFLAMLGDVPVTIGPQAEWMPRGYAAPDEARLELFGLSWLPESPAWSQLLDWWLVHQGRANTPNWDIAVGCTIAGTHGLVLVEAKANRPELGRAGKPLAANASPASRRNHEQIGRAIDEARQGLQSLHPDVSISRDSHYQLANRLAFTWKLATLGIPVVLVYLGFTGDNGISDVGEPFHDTDAWNSAFASYIDGVVPAEMFERRLEVGTTPFWLLSRSRQVLEASQPGRGS